MNSYAEASDVAAVWRPLTPAEDDIVEAVIAEASRKLRSSVPRIDRILLNDPTKAALAKDAVVNAVIRRFQNVNGVLQFSIDDYTERRDASVSTGKLYIDPNDITGLVTKGKQFGTIYLKAGM